MQTSREIDVPFIPYDVAMMAVRGNMPLFKAWRIRLNMTVEELAAAAGMRPEEVTGFDIRENLYSQTLLHLARAMNLDVEQIVDIVN